MASRIADSRKAPTARSLPSAMLTAVDRDEALRVMSLILASGSADMSLRLLRSDGEGVELSPGLVTVLEAAAGMVAGGTGVAVLAANSDLTSQKAAEVLGVSRQFMVRLLDRGDIPSFKIGSHRRVSVADLVAYRNRRDQARRAALGLLVADAEAEGAYGQPAQFGPRRRG